eukprot:3811179-Rhodomonas_salina.2
MRSEQGEKDAAGLGRIQKGFFLYVYPGLATNNGFVNFRNHFNLTHEIDVAVSRISRYPGRNTYSCSIANLALLFCSTQGIVNLALGIPTAGFFRGQLKPPSKLSCSYSCYVSTVPGYLQGIST